MPKRDYVSYGPQAEKRASCLLEALLTYANDELENYNQIKIGFDWDSENRLIIRTTLQHLEFLVTQVFRERRLKKEEIREVLIKLYKDLGIFEDLRDRKQGSENWHFRLFLWFDRHEKAANLKRFHEEWERKQLEKSSSSELQSEDLEIDKLVQLMREKVRDSIQARCGHIRVLDMSQPMSLDAIYTTVYLYESINGRRRRALSDLLQQASIHLDQIQEARISGLRAVEQYSKLVILGKPGTGKTTFLKWLAIQCSQGQVWASLVPVFIPLKVFAEAKGQPELLSYVHEQWARSEGIAPAKTAALLQRGRALILLDGLDEVREADYKRIVDDIEEFSHQFDKCLFVITCRIASQEYTFQQFTEVEIADFDDQQIVDFVTLWFEAKNNSAKAEQFLEKLRDHQRIWDLATNPLLLTLLCLVFQEAADLPSNRSELYREGLEVLLRTWDIKRNIERARVHQRSDLYQRLPLHCKEELLSDIAFTTFERGDYFFKQQVIEQYIANFLHTLPTLDKALESFEIDGEAVLKSIEAQHGLLVERARGVYSFSHLTFHEYFTAKYIVNKSGEQTKKTLQALVTHVTNEKWREIFLLSVSMLPSADALLMMMKTRIDELLSSDPELQQFLLWLNGRTLLAINNSSDVGIYYKPAVIKAYHSFLIFDNDSIKTSAVGIGSAVNRTSVIDRRAINISTTSNYAAAIDSVISTANTPLRAIAIAMVISGTISRALETAVERSIAVSNAIDKAITLTLDPELSRSLQTLKTQLPDPEGALSVLQQWWKNYGSAWMNQLREAQIRYRNLVYDCQFSASQVSLLEQYYRANLLLVDCLNSDCAVTPSVREELEATLLLAIEDIEQYKNLQKSKADFQVK